MTIERTNDWHLSEVDFFNHLPAEKEAFMSYSKRKKYGKGSIIFLEEEPGCSCFYVETGIIKIFRTTHQGKEPIFFLRKKGEMFGIAEVIDAKNRKANAQTLTPCVLREIQKKDFETLLTNYPTFAKTIIRVLGRRIRYLGQTIENLITCDVTNRLAKLLVYLSINNLSDHESWVNPVIVPISLTQEQMADMTGSCQQTISETLSYFQKQKLIKVRKKQITILNPLVLLSNAVN